MKVKKVIICLLLCLILTLSLTACGSGSGSDASSASASQTSAETVSADVTNPDDVDDLKIDNTKWKYDESNDVYYQIGVSYCTDSADEDYETLAVYVPGAYMDAKDNGAGTSTLSKYWRINTGIEQGDTSLTTEMNLALALQSADGVEDVDFTTVWGQGHTTAERSGSSTDNLIDWINECCSAR